VRFAEQLTSIWDWAEAIFAGNVVFRAAGRRAVSAASLVAARPAPRNGDFRDADGHRRGRSTTFAERDLRYTVAMFELLTTDREFADHKQGAPETSG